MKTQHVLVLGAGGNVSRHSVPKLVEAGHKVTALVRNPDHAKQLVDDGATALVRDLTTLDQEDWARLLTPFDVVVWSAGAGGGSAERTWAVDRDAAMAMIEAVGRLVPGVVGNPASLVEESHEDGLLEYPVYTKPADWRGRAVPPVLLSGDHGKVAAWRRAQQEERTRERRPDLWAAYDSED